MTKPATHPFANTLKTFKVGSATRKFHSLPALAKRHPGVKRLPVSLRIVLESVLRHCDGARISAEHVRQLAEWQPNAARTEEIPFVVARVVLQDFTGVPLLADLAAMRSAAARLGRDPKLIEPLVPVDLVIDHSVMIDHYAAKNALDLNMRLEFKRNQERYAFLKWGMQAFDTFRVVPPGFGIVHQINLEYLARGVVEKDGVTCPDTLVGTDSHTTMINGIGVVGWGVGGIEAEAAMLGQPVYLLMPDVVGFELIGALREGVTATDLVLTVTEMLRREKVVGKFVEFFGAGTRTLALPDRATIANMAPEYGATMGFFPVDARTIDYFKGTGRTPAEIDTFEAYFKAQGLFGVPLAGEIDYSSVVTLDLATVAPSLAGPKRPQDRIEITHLSQQFTHLFSQPVAQNGFNQPAAKLQQRYAAGRGVEIRNGDVLIAAITSCTNTSNPSVMLAAGLLAKKAIEASLRIDAKVKTSLAPGSRMVTEYLTRAGLLPYLEQLGFGVAAYGCTTCIGNAGDLTREINEAIISNDLVCAAVLSGNRNFEARIHPNLKANFLASPPLVVAYAIAGNVTVDLMTQPVGRGRGKDGKPRDIYLGDIWPSSDEVYALMKFATDGKAFKANYARVKSEPGPLWEGIKGVSGTVYDWPKSTYIAEPPFFADFTLQPGLNGAYGAGGADGAAAPVGVRGARIIALFGDSITTDHISPAGSIKDTTPGGKYLIDHGVAKTNFNSYGARRGNHEVMMRGTFANVRIKNMMIPAAADGAREEGGVTLFHGADKTREAQSDARSEAQIEAHGQRAGSNAAGTKMFLYDAAIKYRAQGTPTVVFGGEEYGTGSSRDWAAKGTALLGIKAVVARSFERIHRSNLVGMGVLPLQFKGTDSWQTLDLTGSEVVDVVTAGALQPLGDARLIITNAAGVRREVAVTLRIDTAIEVEYTRHGGILPYVLRQLLAA